MDDTIVEALLVPKASVALSEGLGATDYYWGLPTAAINWCESDYAQSAVVAEFFNTLSNAVFVVVGAVALVRCFSGQQRRETDWHGVASALCIVMTGISSGVFHATLRLEWQRADEVFENGILVFMLHAPSLSSYSSRSSEVREKFYFARALVHFFIAAAGIFYVTSFLFCEIHLISVVVLTILKFRNDLPGTKHEATASPQPAKGVHNGTSRSVLFEARKHMNRSVLWVLLGALCWIVDRTCCSFLHRLPINPQLHAWWHLFTALSLHEAMQIVALRRVASNDARKDS